MKLVKKGNGYETTNGKYAVKLTHSRIKGLYPKYYVVRDADTGAGRVYACTLKEAQDIIKAWEQED